MRTFNDLSGKTFSELKVMKSSGFKENKSGRKIYFFNCICTCGKIKEVSSGNLTSGNTKSCGCKYKNRDGGWKNKHGMGNKNRNRFYRSWTGIKDRCYGPNYRKRYLYQDRGITVCDKWLSFEGYKEDMYESYLKHVEEFGEKETTLDRIDNDKGYLKENCRWATYKEQNINRRPFVASNQFIKARNNCK